MRYVLWLQWQGFYADDDNPEPEVVVRDGCVLDANLAARRKNVEVGMGLPHVGNLAYGCIKKIWCEEAFIERQLRWLDLCVPYTGWIEPIDGHIAAVDLSSHPNPKDIAERLVGRLVKNMRLPLQYGAGPSKWVARLAANQHDLTQAAKNPQEFLSSFNVNDLAPVEPEHRARLSFLGYRTIGEIAAIPLEILQGQFDQAALIIQHAAQGKSYDAVRPLYPPHILTECLHYESPIDDLQTLERTLKLLAKRLTARLEGRQAGEVTLFTTWEDGQEQESKRRFTRPIHDPVTLNAALRSLDSLREARENVISLRATLSNLETAKSKQNRLFEAQGRPPADTAIQSLQATFGNTAIRLGSQVELPRRERVLKEWRNATGWR